VSFDGVDAHERSKSSQVIVWYTRGPSQVKSSQAKSSTAYRIVHIRRVDADATQHSKAPLIHSLIRAALLDVARQPTLQRALGQCVWRPVADGV
jgi:hypothetical protein